MPRLTLVLRALSTEAPAVTERSVVEGARAGDPAALERIARDELPRVQRLLLRLLGPRHDLDDLVQNVFLEMCRAFPRFRGESTVSTFVGGIAVQVARRAMRPSAYETRRQPMPEELGGGLSAEERVASRAQLAAVRAVLGELSEDKRIAFSLWALEGLAPTEIAAMVGATPSAVRARIYQAQIHLKARAAEDPRLRDLVDPEAP